MKTINIFDISIFAESKDNFFKYIKNNKNNFVTTVNAEFLVESEKNNLFKHILKSAEFCLPDGISIRASAWIQNHKKTTNKFADFFKFLFLWIIAGFKIIFDQKSLNVIPQRICGSDLFWDILDYSLKNQYSVYFLGGSKEVLYKTVETVKQNYSNLKIAGYSYSDWEDKELPNKIAKIHPDVIFVAFGAPKQEIFLYKNKKLLNYKLGIGVGGTYDFVSGKRKRAPKFFQKIGLEWLWRLIFEPKRAKRIFNAVFVFPLMFIKKQIR